MHAILAPLHECTNHMQIHPKPHNDAMKQWVHLTHLLFSRTQGRLRMYLHMISTFMQRVYERNCIDSKISDLIDTINSLLKQTQDSGC
jgi:hypothetical protein